MNNNKFKNISKELSNKLQQNFISGMFPEVGYTPRNLKFLMQFKGLSVAEVAKICEVKYANVLKWRTDLEKQNHRAMPHKKWQKLMKIEKCYNFRNIVTGDCDIGDYCADHSSLYEGEE